MTAPEDLTVENFGPLLSMVGTWEGHKGMDFSYHNEAVSYTHLRAHET